jgi:CTP-dependent riboflavin kinase
MKKYTTKRVLAGVLAVMTVAGSAPANVGGLLLATNTAIVASAADEETYDIAFGTAGQELWRFVNSVQFGTETVSNITKTKAASYPIPHYSTVTLKTTIPVTLAYNSASVAVGDIAVDGTTGVYGYGITLADSTKKSYYLTANPLYYSASATDALNKAGFFVSVEGSQAGEGTTTDFEVPAEVQKLYYADGNELKPYNANNAKDGDKVYYVSQTESVFKCQVNADANYVSTKAKSSLEDRYAIYKSAKEDDVKTIAVKQIVNDKDKTDFGDIINDAVVADNGTVSLGLDITASSSAGVWTYTFDTANKDITVTPETASATVLNGYAAGADATVESLFGPDKGEGATNRYDAKIKSTDNEHDTNVANLKITRTVDPTNANNYVTPEAKLEDSLTTVFQNEELILTANEYFEAWIWDGQQTTTVTHKYATLAKDGTTYELKANALVSKNTAGINQPTKILVQKATPKYTYELTDDDATLKTKTPVVATAASITGKGYAYDTETSAPAASGTELKSNAAALANGSKVTLTFKQDTTTYTVKDGTRWAAVKITRDGKELADGDMVWVTKKDGTRTKTAYTDIKRWDATSGAIDGAVFEFLGAGKYAVECTVYVNQAQENVSTASIKDYTMKYNFEIAKRTAPTTKNVTLSALNRTDSTWKTKLKTVTEDGTVKIKDAKLVNGVFVFELKQGQTMGGKTFDVDPTLFTEAAKQHVYAHKNKTFTGGEDIETAYDDRCNKNGSTYWVVSGATSVSSTNKKQKITITYSDPEITTGEQTLDFYWMVTEAETTVAVVDADIESYMLPDYPNFDLADVDWDDTDVEDHDAAFPWKPGDYSKKTITNASNMTVYTYNGIVTSLDEIDQLEQRLMDSFIVVNGSKDDVTLEYVKGAGVQLKNDEMDTHYKGVPSEVGDYSVYVMYKGKAKNVIDVHISEHSLYAAPTAEQLNHTFGTALFNDKTLAFNDANGNKVTDVKIKNLSITRERLYALSKAASRSNRLIDGKLDGIYEIYEIDGVKYSTSPVVNDHAADSEFGPCGSSESESETFLGSGHYLVTVQQSEDTQISKDGYSISAQKFVVNVDKKEIRKDMILIDPAIYTGKSITLDASTIHAKDIDLPDDFTLVGAEAPSREVSMKVTEGLRTGVEVNPDGYGITVAPADSELNYTSTVGTAWYIVMEAEDENLTDLDWLDDESTIYDADGGIYVKCQRPADTSFDSDYEIDDYGIMWEAQGKIDIPDFLDTDAINNSATPIANRATAYQNAKKNVIGSAQAGIYAYDSQFDAQGNAKVNGDAGIQAAYTALQYGNGTIKWQSQSPKATNKQLATAIIYVKDAPTGVYVRQYVVAKNKKTGKKKVYYGQVRYVNIVDEATICLNLATATAGSAKEDVKQAAVTRKSVYDKASQSAIASKSWRKDVKAGFNEKTGSYNVYSYFNLKTTQASHLKQDDIKRFGYAVDATGDIKDATDAAKRLKFDAGFTEGFASKNNPVMASDEAGASIFAKSSVCDVYVRTGVDFGKGIVVYTDPIKLDSVSKQFTVKPTLAFADITSKTGKFGMFVTSDVPTLADPDATLVRTGVIADFSGSFLKCDKATGAYSLIEDAQVNAKLTLENAGKNKYLIGKEDFTDETYGECDAYKTPSTDSRLLQIPAVVRSFSIYKINGQEIAVYSDPMLFRGDDTYKGNAAGTKRLDLGDLGYYNANLFTGKKIDGDTLVNP